MSKVVVICGFDGRYAPLAEGLLASIEEPARIDSVDIGILDFGLTTEQREGLQRRCFNVVTPDWDYDLTIFRAPPLVFQRDDRATATAQMVSRL